MATKQNIEILYVSGSSLDRRGKRALVRDSGFLRQNSDILRFGAEDTNETDKFSDRQTT